MAKKVDTKGKKRAKDEDDDEHGEKDISAALESLDEDEWGETPEGGFSDVPDNKYQVQITKATINHSKSSARLQISYELTIMSGKFKGRKLFKHDGLDNAQSRSFARGALAKLGIEWPDTPAEMPEKVEEAQGMYALVTAKTKPDGDIQNVYFDKAIDEDDLDSDDADESDDGDEDAESEDEDEAEESEESEDESDDDSEEDEEGVKVKFAAKDLSKSQKKAIKELAVQVELDLDAYDDLADALADIAENVKVSGTFDDPDELIAVVAKKAKKAKAK